VTTTFVSLAAGRKTRCGSKMIFFKEPGTSH
jgi:hypothetical protein